MLSGDKRGNAGGDNKANEPESTFNEDMPVERLLEAEMAVEPPNSQYIDSNVSHLSQPVNQSDTLLTSGAAG